MECLAQAQESRESVTFDTPGVRQDLWHDTIRRRT